MLFSRVLFSRVFKTILFSAIFIKFPFAHSMDKQVNRGVLNTKPYTHIFENAIPQKSFAIIMRKRASCEKIYVLNPKSSISFSTEELQQYTTIEFVQLERKIDPSNQQDREYLDSISSTIRYGFSISRDLEELRTCKQTIYSLENFGSNSNDDRSFCINFLTLKVSYTVDGKKESLGWKRIDANEEIISEEEN